MASPDAEHQPRPNINMIPATMEYLRHYVIDTAYIAPQERAESSKAYKRRIYNTMITLLTTTTNQPKNAFPTTMAKY